MSCCGSENSAPPEAMFPGRKVCRRASSHTTGPAHTMVCDLNQAVQEFSALDVARFEQFSFAVPQDALPGTLWSLRGLGLENGENPCVYCTE